MEKGIGFAGGSQPSAPPPTAPPSYEEAIGNASNPPAIPNNPPYPVGPSSMPGSTSTVPPYPVGPSSMPVPTWPSNPPNQATTSFLPKYPRVHGEPSTQPQPQQQPQQQNANQNFAPPTEVRIIHQSVTYSMSPNPVKMSCPTCHASIKTATISDHQPSAHICCIILCLLGCCLCSCLPYCMSSFMSIHHFCPNCKNYIGTWKG